MSGRSRRSPVKLGGTQVPVECRGSNRETQKKRGADLRQPSSTRNPSGAPLIALLRRGSGRSGRLENGLGSGPPNEADLERSKCRCAAPFFHEERCSSRARGSRVLEQAYGQSGRADSGLALRATDRAWMVRGPRRPDRAARRSVTERGRRSLTAMTIGLQGGDRGQGRMPSRSRPISIAAGRSCDLERRSQPARAGRRRSERKVGSAQRRGPRGGSRQCDRRIQELRPRCRSARPMTHRRSSSRIAPATQAAANARPIEAGAAKPRRMPRHGADRRRWFSHAAGRPELRATACARDSRATSRRPAARISKLVRRDRALARRAAAALERTIASRDSSSASS